MLVPCWLLVWPFWLVLDVLEVEVVVSVDELAEVVSVVVSVVVSSASDVSTRRTARVLDTYVRLRELAVSASTYVT